ncbi:MAG: hypothetical protein IPG61_08180 [bacterium]|nr:hypothetical protein [bacterium]
MAVPGHSRDNLTARPAGVLHGKAWRTIVLGGALAIIALAAACKPAQELGEDSAAASKPANTEHPRRNASAPQVAFVLSPAAKEVRDLLEARSYAAAERCLDGLLQAETPDAGVYAMYARYLVESSDPAHPGFILSPMAPDDRYWALGLAAEAVEVSAGLEPGIKPFLCDEIMGALALATSRAFSEDRGCVGASRVLYDARAGDYRIYLGGDMTMLNIGWTALRCDNERASTWVPRFRDLLARSIERGKPVTAMMMGNLIGDMIQGGTGSRDFEEANMAFLRSLTNFVPDPEVDWLNEAAALYPDCFREELLAIVAGGTSPDSFVRLKVALASRGHEIPMPSATATRNREYPTGVDPRQ